MRVASGVFKVGGPDLSHPDDCLCYLIIGFSARVLVDAGAGRSAKRLLKLAEKAAGRPPTDLFLTHAHIDHAGGAAEIKALTGCRVIIHAGDAAALANGDPRRSAAEWYGLRLKPCPPDQTFDQPLDLDLGQGESLHLLSTPGHTPGSAVAWLDREGQRLLFGQDIHGPFAPEFDSDLGQWRASMGRLLDLRADLLAEGHYGVIRGAERVREFIQGHLDRFPA